MQSGKSKVRPDSRNEEVLKEYYHMLNGILERLSLQETHNAKEIYNTLLECNQAVKSVSEGRRAIR